MIKFKNKRAGKGFKDLHTILLMIFADLYTYTYEKHGINLVVTQTTSDSMMDKALGRVSDSHRTKRAIDIRTKDLDAYVLEDILNYINRKRVYEKYHYISHSGVKRLAYWHFGTNEHIHLSINKIYAQ